MPCATGVASPDTLDVALVPVPFMPVKKASTVPNIKRESTKTAVVRVVLATRRLPTH